MNSKWLAWPKDVRIFICSTIGKALRIAYSGYDRD